MGTEAEHDLLVSWGYSSAEATRMTGHIPVTSNGGNGASAATAHRHHVDRLKYNAWFDDQQEADRLEAEGDELQAAVLRSSVNEIDDMYEATNIGGSVYIKRTNKWGRLNVEHDEPDDDAPAVVTEADVDQLWNELHPDDSSEDDDDSGVTAIGTEHVGEWGHERSSHVGR